MNGINILKNPRVLMIDAMAGNDYSIILCKALHKEGVDVTLVITEDRKLFGDELFKIKKWLPSKVKGKNRLIKSLKYFRYLIKLFFYIRKNADVVHYQYFRRKRIESIFYVLLSKTNARLVYTVHDVVPLDENSTDRFLNNYVYKASTSLIVHSQPNRKLLNDLNVSLNKIKVVPHGNFDMFLSGDNVTRECAREKLKLKQDSDVLLFFGSIKKYKGLDLLVDVFEICSALNNNLHLIIAGSVETDELNTHYLNKINSLHSKERIIYKNNYINDNDVKIYFQASDVVVLPYRQISHSGVMHLAYSFGRPLIVTDVGDFAYTVTEDKSGFVVHKRDADLMAEKIMEVFSNKKLLEDMSIHILELNNSKYTWENSAKLTKEIYEDINK